MSPKNKKKEKVRRYTAMEYNPDYLPLYEYPDVKIVELAETEHGKDKRN